MKWKTWPRLAVALLVSGLALGLTVPGRTDSGEQSPIDIHTADAIQARLPQLEFRYRRSTPLEVINTGSPDENATVRAVVPSGAGRLRVGGVTSKLLQFHWHAPAEHLINGHQYPMEMHLVHQAQNGALSVVGIFIKQGKANKELAKIFRRLPQNNSDSTSIRAFDLTRLLPRSHRSFRYFGSLTTPPFTEGVRWAVLAQPLSFSEDQIEAFQALFPEGNAREVEPLNNRVVLTDLRFGIFSPLEPAK